MKKILITASFLALLGASVFAQELEKIAEIEVSSTKKVSTFKAKNTASIKINDIQKDSSLTVNQSNIIEGFLSIHGVESAVYDKATNSYTVVSNIKTIVNLPLKLKND